MSGHGYNLLNSCTHTHTKIRVRHIGLADTKFYFVPYVRSPVRSHTKSYEVD